ncbi:MAG: MOSC domain-containing protein [Verrucomicrobia bacterium]|nr:MOSC domain-containing protein [Cytophagales bacterium]
MSYFLSEIFVYPIKSLGGIALQKALVTDRGLQYDRRWMLIDSQNRFKTQRQHPQMALLQVSITGNGLEIFHKTKKINPLFVPFEPENPEKKQVQIWDDICQALTVSRLADEWFSEVLQEKCQLVFMPDESRLLVDTRYATHQEITSLSDGYPFLIIGQASLDFLNNKLTHQLPINRFRPNLVFTGGTPHEEDNWQEFTMQNINFFGVKPCARCVVTTIDQATGLGGKEPLATLNSYRKKGNKILFGQNLLHQNTGFVQVGDQIFVSKRSPVEP